MVSEILADDYPSTCQTCICVLPFSTGENSLQSLNTMLSLTKAYETSNGVILFENDRYDSICKNVFKDRSFCAINNCMANSLFSNIQPIAETCLISRKTLYRNNVEKMMRDLCPYPKHKLLTSRALPVGSRKNLSYENPTHGKLLSQLVESINESLLPFETVEPHDVDVDVHYSTFVPTGIQQGNVVGPGGVYSQVEEGFLYKTVNDIQILAPSYLSAKNGVLTNKKKPAPTPSKGSNLVNKNVKLINTGGVRKKPIKKNIVTSLNINVGGILEEGIDLAQHLSQVLFWGHSLSPASVSTI